MATVPVRNLDLVVPLAHEATDMRITETSGLVAQDRSGAVSPLIGASLRQGDVNSTTRRSTLAPQTMPGIRISTMETRITTTRTTSSEPEPSAEQTARHHADFVLDRHCNGCRHCYYSKPSSQKEPKFSWQSEVSTRPHVRCLFFNDDIRIVIEMSRGCDGKNSPNIIGYELPRNCPELLKRSQRSLF